MDSIDTELLKKRLEEGRQVTDIAQEFGCCRQTVYNRINQLGLTIKNGPDIIIDPEWLREQKMAMRTDAEVAQKLGVTAKYIAEQRRVYDIPGAKVSPTGKQQVRIDPEWLREQKAKGRTDKDIAREIGCGIQTIIRNRKRYDIPSYEKR